MIKKILGINFLILAICSYNVAGQSPNYLPISDNLGLDLNSGSNASSIGKLFAGSNAPVPYGQFLSFGSNTYSTQFNSQHSANGLTYMRVNGDGGIGSWNYLYHSGLIGQLKTDLGIPSNGETFSSVTDKGSVTSAGREVQFMSVNPNQTYTYVGGNANYARIGAYCGLEDRFADLIMGEGSSNIGIGTSTPTEKLSVNGKIRAKEIKVEATNWPDYVFEQGYKVDKLDELESYIKTNKHLPEVSSAKEVADDGISLGEMNKLLLKKVEELTLLLIEKDKQMDDLLEKDRLKSKTISHILMRLDKLDGHKNN